MNNEKPLFIPLKTEYFDDFKSGIKDIEYRICGPRWNEKTCRVGRAATISKGFGNKDRLSGKVSSFERRHATSLPVQAQEAIYDCYGTLNREIACIGITID